MIALRIINIVALVQLALTAALCFWSVDQKPQMASILWGSGVAIFNFSALVLLWRMIFQSSKKRVALAVFLIVIKYAILVTVFVLVPRSIGLSGFEFALGVLTNPLAVILVGLNNRLISKYYFSKFGK